MHNESGHTAILVFIRGPASASTNPQAGSSSCAPFYLPGRRGSPWQTPAYRKRWQVRDDGGQARTKTPLTALNRERAAHAPPGARQLDVEPGELREAFIQGALKQDQIAPGGDRGPLPDDRQLHRLRLCREAPAFTQHAYVSAWLRRQHPKTIRPGTSATKGVPVATTERSSWSAASCGPFASMDDLYGHLPLNGQEMKAPARRALFP
ncbi:MAG TPA: hypothetical protein VF171_04450, partial [Trueperaceae bacterium]